MAFLLLYAETDVFCIDSHADSEAQRHMFLSNLCMCVQPCTGLRAINIKCDQTPAHTHKPKREKKTPNQTKRRCVPYVCVCIRVKTRDLWFDGATRHYLRAQSGQQTSLASPWRLRLQPSTMCDRAAARQPCRHPG